MIQNLANLAVHSIVIEVIKRIRKELNWLNDLREKLNNFHLRFEHSELI